MTLFQGTATPIQTVTVDANGISAIEFTNIPQIYTDLLIKYSLRTNESSGIYTDTNVQLNSTNSSNGKVFYVISGTTVGSYSPSAVQSFFAMSNGNASTSSTFGNGEIYIPNYKSNSNKSILGDNVVENNGTSNGINISVGLYSVTSAITSFKLTPAQNYANPLFLQHSTATLYGIRSSAVGAKATGGVITEDANYYYHNFYASGDFTPSTNLSCDYLVVGGGGPGGASYLAGGGGAGGYRTATGTSFSNGTTYTITVGAGGAGKDAQGAFNGRNNGSVSSISGSGFSTFTSSGGGCGGHNQANVTAGVAGGSGGGAANPPAAAGSGNVGGYSPSEGNAGGVGAANGNASAGGGGGGGGAGSVGGNSTSSPEVGGAGGAGSQWLNGSYYAGGGGSGVISGAIGGVGGIGGGATGGGTSAAPAGSPNTGGGGGGAGSFNGGAGIGGNGGSGIVIIRYAK